MDSKNIWDVLGIKETKNEEEIRKAYRDKLVYVNPEDNPEGFMQLRKAYEAALRSVHEKPGKMPDVTKNDVDLWIDKVSDVYNSLESRRNADCWRKLFKDDICTGLDTNLEAREKLLRFLMDHYYLPHGIWKLIEKEFDIIADKEQLYEIFPRSFIDYVVSQITIEDFLDYSLFNPKSGEDADEYIKTYFRLKAAADEKKADDCQKIIDEIDKYETYHPYEDVEKIRYYLLTDRVPEAADLAEPLFSYQDNPYIMTACALVKNKQKNYDDAAEIFQKVLKDYPRYYMAKMGLIECLYGQKKYKEAKELVIDILDDNLYDQTAYEYMVEINNNLISGYREAIAQGKDGDNNKIKLEMAWCLYQNNEFDKYIEILEELPASVRHEYDFINLHGRVYLAAGKYNEALDKLKLWLKTILKTERNDSEESKKRYARLGHAYYFVGICYINLQKYDEAEIYLKKSIEAEEKINDKLMSMERLAYTYIKAKKFLECIKICEEIIGISREYYPAYLLRQEAYYELGNDQEAINDYYRAVEIYPGFIRPYLFAIKVFIKHGQYDDAKKVIEAVKKVGLDSNEFRLLCIRLTRLKQENTKEERIEAIKACEELKKMLQTENNDIEDTTEVDYELAMLYVQEKEYEKAAAATDEIINKKPGEDYYKFLKGQLLRKAGKYDQAVVVLTGLLDKHPDTDKLYYEIGCCYLDQGRMKQALVYFVRTAKINHAYNDVNSKITDIYRHLLKNTGKMEYYEAALPYADKQIELIQDAYTYTQRGLLNLDAYELDKAISDFNIALEYRPDHHIIYNNIGVSYILMRDMDKAIQYLKKSVSLAAIGRDKPYPFFNLARAYYITEEYDKSLEYYELLHGTYPENPYYIEKIIDIYKIKRDIQNSITYVNKLSNIKNYRKTDIETILGYIYYFNGDFEKAEKHYKLSLDVGNSLSYLRFAEFLLLTNQYSRSLSVIEDGIKVAEKNKKNQNAIEFYVKAALVYWSVKTFDRNLSGLRRILYEGKAKKLAGKALNIINHIYPDTDVYYEFPRTKTVHLMVLVLIYLIMNDAEKAEYYIKKALVSKLCYNCNYKTCIFACEINEMIDKYRNQPDRAEEACKAYVLYDLYSILRTEK